MNCPTCNKQLPPPRYVTQQQLDAFKRRGRVICNIGMWSHVAGKDSEWMVYHKADVPSPDNINGYYFAQYAKNKEEIERRF